MQVGGSSPVLEIQDVQLAQLAHLADEQQAPPWTLLQEGRTCLLQPEQGELRINPGFRHRNR